MEKAIWEWNGVQVLGWFRKWRQETMSVDIDNAYTLLLRI
jgi:hypothetical protein